MNRCLVSLVVVVLGATAAPAQTQKRKNTLLGRVVTTGREAVADAKVVVRWRTAPELPCLAGWSLPGTNVSGVTEREVQTDASGRWRMQLPVHGPFEVLARSGDGSLRSVRRFPVMAGSFVEQVVRPAFFVAGTVRDAAGDPAKQLRLSFDPLRSTWTRLMCYGAPLTRGHAVTGDDGTFSFALASAHAQERMWAPYLDVMPADGRFHFLRNPLLQPIDACAELTLQLEPTPVQKGFVRDIKGKGIAGARVYRYLEPWRSVLTKADGSFAIPAPRASQLAAAKDGYTPQRMPALEGRKKLDEPKLLELVPSRRIRIRLVDQDGAALQKHAVLWSFAQDNEPPLERVTQTGDDGELVLEDAPLGMVTRGFVKYQGVWCRFLQTVATQNVKLQDRVVAVRELRGSVVDPQNLPVAGARVVVVARLEQVAKDQPKCMWVTYTDHGGRYRFPAMPAGRLFVYCEASTDGFASVEVAADQERGDLKTGTNEVVRVRVLDRDGEPVAKAWVSLTARGGIVVQLAPSPTPSQTTVVGFSDEAGNVEFHGLPRGPWQLFGHAIRAGELLSGTGRWRPGDEQVTVELR